MRTVVVGSGPVGLFCGMVLARRGERVTVVDRDPGPAKDGTWRRRGVMQYAHPHFFRHPVRQALLEELPDVWHAVVAAGGVPACFEGMPEFLTGLQCRRSTLERVLWAAACQEPGLSLRTGVAKALRVEGGRVTGVVVDGALVQAGRVVCATGRGSSLGDDLRAPGQEDACGFSYVARMYRARRGADWPTWPLSGQLYDGYQAILFPQDDRTLSALIVRPTADSGLMRLRGTAAFDTATGLIPQLSPWTDTSSFEPITAPMSGGRLTNGYRGQLDQGGRVSAAGVHFVGDAVCTTNPAAGRGVTLGLRQAQALLGLLVLEPDARDVAEGFDAWCTENVKPWYDDHVFWDADLLRRFAGQDVAVEQRLSSDIMCAAGEADPSLMSVIGPFLSMTTMPASLSAVEESVRTLLRAGWRPSYAPGPTRDELVVQIAEPGGVYPVST